MITDTGQQLQIPAELEANFHELTSLLKFVETSKGTWSTDSRATILYNYLQGNYSLKTKPTRDPEGRVQYVLSVPNVDNINVSIPLELHESSLKEIAKRATATQEATVSLARAFVSDPIRGEQDPGSENLVTDVGVAMWGEVRDTIIYNTMHNLKARVIDAMHEAKGEN